MRACVGDRTQNGYASKYACMCVRTRTHTVNAEHISQYCTNQYKRHPSLGFRFKIIRARAYAYEGACMVKHVRNNSRVLYFRVKTSMSALVQVTLSCFYCDCLLSLWLCLLSLRLCLLSLRLRL